MRSKRRLAFTGRVA